MTFSKPTKDIYGILIIDECSMIDAELFDDINNAASFASIVYVGDPAQLPPTSGNGALSPVFSINERAHLSELLDRARVIPLLSYQQHYGVLWNQQAILPLVMLSRW